MIDEARFQMNANLHAAFRRELRRLDAALTATDLADPAARIGLQRRFRFFADTLHTHHVGEDRFIWPQALAQASAAEKAVLTAMEAEHAALAAVLDEVATDFAEIGPQSDLVGVRARLADLETVLVGHCQHEERDAVPIAAKYLTAHDLAELVAHSRAQPQSDLVLAWVCDGAPPDVVRSTWAQVPGPVRMFLRPITARRYARFSAECGV